MKHFVEFYFLGLPLGDHHEREIASRDPSSLKKIPSFAYGYRFFDRNDDSEEKINFSGYYYFGKEYSTADLKVKYPHIDHSKFQGFKRVVKTSSGNLYPLNPEDQVVSI